MNFFKLKISIILLGILSCKSDVKDNNLYSNIEEKQMPVELGESVFNGHGMCYTCHKIDKKVIGPSVTEIATIYKNKKGNIIQFLLEKAPPIVDPSQYATMKTNFAITKNLPKEELEALQTYMMQFAK